MDDYDWMVDNQSHWSDWSTWPAARLNYANQFAVSITGWLLQQPEYKPGAAPLISRQGSAGSAKLGRLPAKSRANADN
ncbi:hypothetical protein B1H58_13720 [Pantoea alhagi]|uniref:Uncharacterized protein n=1 Tax=Pantoea alhagi TaxID=1891675 RepID=A0A1W6B7D7_9GAMM|nr:hypothetical protein B1H58_13720 [Pantoea alhagi]